MRIALAETAAQAAAAPPGWEVLALEPDAQVELLRAGRPFRTPQEYVSWDRLEMAGLATFPLLERLCDLLDEHIAVHIPAVSQYELRPARWQLFLLKQIVDVALTRALRLRAVREREHPQEISFFGPLVARAKLDEQRGLRAHLSRTVRRHVHRTGDILLLDRGYGVGAIGDELRQMGQRVITLGPPRPTARWTDATLWSAIEADVRIRSLLHHHDAGDLWDEVAEPLREAIELAVPMVVAEHDRVRQIVERARPAAALASMAAYPDQKARCHALRQARVPVAVARHGELGTRHVAMGVYQDVESVDWALCWGRWEAQWVERHARQPVATTVVGSPTIEASTAAAPSREIIRHRLGIPLNVEVALYAPTSLSGREWYAGHRAPDDSTYFAQQTVVIEALAAARCHVLVKEHAAQRPSPLDLWCSGRARVQLVYEPGFSSLIHVADVVVLDAPSTTLAEALFGSAPIVVVDHPVFVWEPGVREHLTAHGVTFSKEAASLARVLDDLPAPHYDALARKPLVDVERSRAARRAALAMVAIASGVSP